MNRERLSLKVTDLRCEARDTLFLELRDEQNRPLPEFSAGAHLEIYLGNGLIRHYSLCNDPAERHRYCLGIGLARDSRGGSKWIHQRLRLGSTLQSSLPRNHFPLRDGPEAVVLIAGGIGITPIMAMIHRCIATGRPWSLYYCARNRSRAAFYEELNALPSGHVRFHFDDERAQVFDPVAALHDISADTHIYTCGPAPLMRAVQAASADRPAEHVHFEWFTAAPAAEPQNQTGFNIVLHRSQRRLQVPPGKSILDVLEESGLGVPSSCREGLCGTCRTPLISGEADHLDKVLNEAERSSQQEIVLCVSRAKSAELVLDL